MTRLMTTARVVLFAAALAATALSSAANAAPVVEWCWDRCENGPINRVPAPGETRFRLYLTVIGLDFPHHGFDTVFGIGSNSGCSFTDPVADAWRFYEGGCATQGTAGISATFAKAPETEGGCPFVGVNPSYPAGHMQVVRDTTSGRPFYGVGVILEDSYVRVATPDPGQRYVLAMVDIDLSNAFSATPGVLPPCSGIETPVCLTFNTLYYTNTTCGPGDTRTIYFWTDQGDHYFGHPVPISSRSSLGFNWNDPSQMCDGKPVPAIPRTWGSIRAQYR